MAKRTRKKAEAVQYNVRIGSDLLAELKRLGIQNEVSTNAEIAKRLGRSVAEEASLGGIEGRKLLYRFASAFIIAGNHAAGHREINRWIKDADAYTAAMFSLVAELLLDHPDIDAKTIDLQLASLKGRITTQLLGRSKS